MNILTIYKAYSVSIIDAGQIEYERRLSPFTGLIETSTDELAKLWQRRKRQRATFARELLRCWRNEAKAVAP